MGFVANTDMKLIGRLCFVFFRSFVAFLMLNPVLIGKGFALANPQGQKTPKQTRIQQFYSLVINDSITRAVVVNDVGDVGVHATTSLKAEGLDAAGGILHSVAMGHSRSKEMASKYRKGDSCDPHVYVLSGFLEK